MRLQGFFLGDMSKLGYMYAIFLIGKRIYMSATTTLADGGPSAILCMISQTLDGFLLFAIRPFNDSQVSTTGVCVLARMLARACVRARVRVCVHVHDNLV